MLSTTNFQDVIELQRRLQDLYGERVLAQREGLLADAAYREDLEDEIAGTEAAYVGAVVTEIATLRGQLSGPLLG